MSTIGSNRVDQHSLTADHFPGVPAEITLRTRENDMINGYNQQMHHTRIGAPILDDDLIR